MNNQFDIKPTADEIKFACAKHLRNLEFFRTQPFVPFSFSEFWNMTYGGTIKMRHAEQLHDIVKNYKSTVILMNGFSGDEELWRAVVLDNRAWVDGLSETEKVELEGFHKYSNWHTGLLICDPITIRGALKLFPDIAGSEQTPEIIWKYENPDSPDRLPGAVHIDTHDAIHCLLGRGALQADEAFVIGFTMGAASNELTVDHMKTFIKAVTTEYPKPYDIHPQYVPSYLAGVAAGIEYFATTGIDLSKTDFSPCKDMPLSRVRSKFGIDENLLSELYTTIEARMIPETKSPQRNRGIVSPDRILEGSPRKNLG